ncbi:MAG: lytic transglycosylase domain-containing protein [bacterium]
MIRFLVLGLSIWVTLLASANAAPIYVYINNQGNRLITDHARSDLKGYRLLRKYQADDYFGTANRPSASKSRLKARVSEYDSLIVTKAKKLGLEPALLKAIIHIESSFNPSAVSPKGATGLMQLMPATAKRYGVTDRFNPSQSLEGGGRYMRDLLLMFNYDTRLALAAYNAGENAVTRYQGVPPYQETEEYVELVLQMLNLYRKELIGV